MDVERGKKKRVCHLIVLCCEHDEEGRKIKKGET